MFDCKFGFKQLPVGQPWIYVSTVGISHTSFPLSVTLLPQQQPERGFLARLFGPDPSQHQVQVEVMDLAGQVEYYVSHQLLLSDVLGLYVVVSQHMQRSSPDSAVSSSAGVSARSNAFVKNPESEAQMRYWLSFLKSMFMQGTRVPVMLALTQLDQLNQQQLQGLQQHASTVFLAGLANDYSPPMHLLGCVALQYPDPDEAKGISSSSSPPVSWSPSEQDLRNQIESQISEMVRNEWIPSSYLQAEEVALQIQSELHKKKALPLMPLDQFHDRLRAKTKSFAEDPGLLDRAVSYLHHGGVVFRGHRSEIVVFDPMQWFPEVLSTLIGSESNRPSLVKKHGSEGGVFEVKELLSHAERVWKCQGVDDVLSVLRLLQGLELCFPLTSKPEDAKSDSVASLVPVPSLAATSTSLYLFPCGLNEINQQIRDQWWPPLPKDALSLFLIPSSAPSVQPVSPSPPPSDALFPSSPSSSSIASTPALSSARKSSFDGIWYAPIQCVGKKWKLPNPQQQIFPPALFPALQSRLFPCFASQSVKLGRHLLVATSSDHLNKARLEMFASQGDMELVVRGQDPEALFQQIEKEVDSAVSSYGSLDLLCVSLCCVCLLQNESVSDGAGHAHEGCEVLSRLKASDAKLPIYLQPQSQASSLDSQRNPKNPNSEQKQLEKNDDAPPNSSTERANGDDYVEADEKKAQEEHKKKHTHRLFVSHSSLDRDTIVRPLAYLLQMMNIPIFYDEFELLHQQDGDTTATALDDRSQLQFRHEETKTRESKEDENASKIQGMQRDKKQQNALQRMCDALECCEHALVLLSCGYFDQTISNLPTRQLEVLLDRMHAAPASASSPTSSQFRLIPIFCDVSNQNEAKAKYGRADLISRLLPYSASSETKQTDALLLPNLPASPPLKQEARNGPDWDLLIQHVIPHILDRLNVQVSVSELQLRKWASKYSDSGYPHGIPSDFDAAQVRC